MYTKILKIFNLFSKKYEEIYENNNNVIFVYYFKSYYIKYKNKTFEKIIKDIIKHANYNDLELWKKLKKCVILYPSELFEEVEKIKDNKYNELFIYIEESNKSIIKHILYD